MATFNVEFTGTKEDVSIEAEDYYTKDGFVTFQSYDRDGDYQQVASFAVSSVLAITRS